jgi:hypothetical protein
MKDTQKKSVKKLKRTLKKTKPREKKYINSPEALAELQKFIVFCGSIRLAAVKLDVHTQSVYAWKLNDVLIPESRAELMSQIASLDKQILIKRAFSENYNIFTSLRELILRENMAKKVEISDMPAGEILDACLSDELLGYINDVNTIDNEEKIKRASKMLSAIFASRPSKWVKDIRSLILLK